MSPLPTLEAIRDDFALLDDWEDRYRYVIELGRMLEPFDESDRTENNKVRGCASQVWLSSLVSIRPNGKRVLTFTGDSDAHIVRGLIAILMSLYTEHSAEEILATNAQATFDELGLSQHLTPQRSNGLASMVRRIRADAEAALARQSDGA